MYFIFLRFMSRVYLCTIPFTAYERGMRGYYWHCHAICQSPQTDDRAPTATIRRLKFRRRQNRKKSKRKCTHAPESLISGCDDDTSGWTGGSYRRQCIWVFAFGNGAGRNGSRMGISVELEPYEAMLFIGNSYILTNWLYILLSTLMTQFIYPFGAPFYFLFCFYRFAWDYVKM